MLAWTMIHRPPNRQNVNDNRQGAKELNRQGTKSAKRKKEQSVRSKSSSLGVLGVLAVKKGVLAVPARLSATRGSR
jgi:hypothetical protein